MDKKNSVKDAILEDMDRLERGGERAVRLKITTDALNDLFHESSHGEFKISAFAGGDTFMGLLVEEVPDGSIDAPYWQLMTAGTH